MNSKFSFLSIIIIICILSVTTVFLTYFFSDKNGNGEIINQENVEAKELKETNQDAITQASKSANYLRNIDNTDHAKGKIDAPVQIIVYTDFECPFCARFYRVIKSVEEEFGDQVVVAIRHYPLVSHFNAVDLAMATECASEQGKFWEMHDAFFESENLNLERVDSIAKKLDLNFVDFKKCLESDKYREFVYSQKAEGKSAGATGAPTVFVNSEILPGAVPFNDYKDNAGNIKEGMKSIIERHLVN